MKMYQKWFFSISSEWELVEPIDCDVEGSFSPGLWNAAVSSCCYTSFLLPTINISWTYAYADLMSKQTSIKHANDRNTTLSSCLSFMNTPLLMSKLPISLSYTLSFLNLTDAGMTITLERHLRFWVINTCVRTRIKSRFQSITFAAISLLETIRFNERAFQDLLNLKPDIQGKDGPPL